MHNEVLEPQEKNTTENIPGRENTKVKPLYRKGAL